MYWTVFVPRNQLSIGEKMRSLSATIAEIGLVTFGDMPQYFPQFWGEGVAVEILQRDSSRDVTFEI